MNTVAMDFGTFNSTMAFRMPNGGIEFVRLPGEASNVIPSYLLMRDGEVEHVGQSAKNALAADPEHVLWGLKRLLGLSHHDAKEQIRRFQYHIADYGGQIRIEVDGHIHAPVDLISSFLGRIRKQACESPDVCLPFGGLPEKLILTHPAYFDTQQIASLEHAAKRAGYAAVQLLREPEAAAMAYKDLIDFSKEPLVMVIDWGAGTLDFFIAHFLTGHDGCPKIVENVPAYGDTKLGGIDMDDALVQRFKVLHGIGESTLEEENRLRSHVENSKIVLSERESVNKVLSFGGQPYAFRLCHTSSQTGSDRWVCLEDTLADPGYGNILGQFKENLRFALKRNNLGTRDIDNVILVGGPMCMPCTRAAVAEVFADNNAVLKQLARIETEGFPINPFEAVAKGAVMSDQVDLGPARLAYTYGFMMDGELVENLVIPRDTLIAQKGNKSVAYNGSIRIRAGDLLRVAVHKAEETPGGQRHSLLGNYDFAPVAAHGRGTAVTPSIGVGSDLICTLFVEDRIAHTTLKLRLKDGQYPLESAPDIMKLISSEEIKEWRTTDPERYRAMTEDWNQGVFGAEEVDRQRHKAVILYRSVQQALNHGRTLPPGAEQLFVRLATALEHVRPGLPVKADLPEAKAFQEMINAYNELSQNLRNDSFEY
jgi:molecular chaperone DnaK (HSP70)